MTGLQVWLHPSSRTKISFEFQVPSFGSVRSANTRSKLETRNLKLDSSSLRGPASVVRNRRYVTDRPHFNSGGSQRSHGRLTARPRTTDANVDAADPMIAGHVRGIRRSLLRGKRS